MAVNQQLINKIRAFIDSTLVSKVRATTSKLSDSQTHFEYTNVVLESPKQDLDPDKEKIKEFVKKNKIKGFRDLLFKFIDDNNQIDAVVYKKALLDRRLFSKIRSNEDYHPNKKTVIALLLALKLELEQGLHLLKAAGYSLSESSVFDLVIVYCVTHELYDLDKVNEILEEMQLTPLGSLD
jgi:hypothetical protein